VITTLKVPYEAPLYEIPYVIKQVLTEWCDMCSQNVDVLHGSWINS